MIRITPVATEPLDEALAERVREMAADLAADPELRRDRERFAPSILDTWPPNGRSAWSAPSGIAVPPGIAVQLNDLSGVPLCERVPNSAWYQHRARVRAGEGDLVLTNRPEPPDYERYNARLGLGTASWLLADDGFDLSRQAWQSPGAFARLVELGRRQPLHLHPYMAFGDVWELAERLTLATGRPVPVVGPPPALCDLVNDKVRFTALLANLLGADAVPEWQVAADPESLAGHLVELARRHPRVALKMGSCALAMGNLVFASTELLARPRPELVAEIRAFLASREWDGAEPVLAMRWEERVLLSPSLQLWIPPAALAAEAVVCEGIFQQRFDAACEGRFGGAALASLPAPLDARLRRQGTAIGDLLRRLGYVGRCSLDLVLIGERLERLEDAEARFVDGNGRWGAVSTPMSLLTRLLGDHRRRPYVIAGFGDPRLAGMRFADLEALLAPDLYSPDRPSGRLIVYNVGLLEVEGKFDVVCLGRDLAEAEDVLSRELPRRLGLL